MSTNATVCVGVDGSQQALAAVRWAARHAQSDNATLRIVHAFHEVWAFAHDLPHHETFEIGRARAEQVVADAELAARATAPTLRITRDVELGDAAHVLRTVAASVDAVVVGHRNRHGVDSLLSGSIGHRLATRAPCPVTVVRGHTTTRGPVVVGVRATADGSAHAVNLAFHQAAVWHCPLIAVHAYVPPVPRRHPDVAVPAYWPEAVDGAERARVEDLLAAARQRHPGVRVTVRLVRGTPSAVLVKASRDAQLVVVGGSGHLAGAVIGTVRGRLLDHADCPVMLAPRVSRREAGDSEIYMAIPRPAI